MNKEDKRLLRRNLSRLELLNCVPCIHKECATCPIHTQITAIGRQLVGNIDKEDKHEATPVTRAKRRKPVTMTVEQYQQYKQEGKSDRAIGELEGLSYNHILDWKRENELAKPKKKVTCRLRLDVMSYIKYKEADLTDQEIAEHIGCTHSTLSRWKRINKIKIKNNPPKRVLVDYTAKQYLADKELKINDRDLAEKLGVSHESLRRWKLNHDISCYSRKGKRRGAYKR